MLAAESLGAISRLQHSRRRPYSTVGAGTDACGNSRLDRSCSGKNIRNTGPDAVLNFQYLVLISPTGSHPIVINWHDTSVNLNSE